MAVDTTSRENLVRQLLEAIAARKREGVMSGRRQRDSKAQREENARALERGLKVTRGPMDLGLDENPGKSFGVSESTRRASHPADSEKVPTR